MAALRQPPPPQNNDDSIPTSQPMSNKNTSTYNLIKTGIEEAFERYAGIETLQNENAFHCHECWKQQNEVQVAMIKRYKDNKKRQKANISGMTPLIEQNSLNNKNYEQHSTNGYSSSSDMENNYRSESDDESNIDSDVEDSENEIKEKDWKSFYGDTTEYINRKQQYAETKALRRTLISISPPILVLHLKRFGNIGGFALSKIFDDISFPTVLDIGPYIAPSRPKKNNRLTEAIGEDNVDPTTNEDFKKLAEITYPVNSTKYKLRSTVNHCGRSMIGGHYTSYLSRECNNEGDLKWFKASDEKVSNKTEEEILDESMKSNNENVYVLIYERI